MLNAIKRTWVPKNAAAQALPPSVAKADEADTAAAPLSIYAGLSLMFDDLPAPQAHEVNSASIWAAFEDVPSMSAPS